jgi:cytochrome P450
VWETLRLTPPTWITARVAARDVQLGAGDIEEGSIVMVSPLLLGRLPTLVPGDDPDLGTFDPCRWSSGHIRPGAWLPFGAGPHACPGRNLGLAMLRHLASWSRDQNLTLPETVAVNQSRGIFPEPALIRVRSGQEEA